ncbi:MAG: hypothetical protein JNM89_05760 [Hyphomicrobiaceae bacterium]|nr:hypothetical protein [Hyphomicrobiaceae bacterium]
MGYTLPDRYKEIVFEHMPPEERAMLDEYWDEVAMERVCSAGQGKPDARRFLGEVGYSSPYLDKLYSDLENRRAAAPAWPLHAGYRQFVGKLLDRRTLGHGFGSKITAALEEHKASEIERFQISAAGWPDKASGLRDVLNDVAAQRGFVKRRNSCDKQFRNGLKVKCKIDAGRRNTWTFGLPIEIEVSHARDDVVVRDFGGLRDICPGYSYYLGYKSPQSGLLGLMATVDLLDIVGNLIEQNS